MLEYVNILGVTRVSEGNGWLVLKKLCIGYIFVIPQHAALENESLSVVLESSTSLNLGF